MKPEDASAGAARFGRFELVAAERRLLHEGEAVALGSRAFDLLAALVERRARIVPKEELIEVVWPGLVVEDNNLQVQISALRKVLGAQAIATVPGRGYRFTMAGAAASATAPATAPAAAPDIAPASASAQAAAASAPAREPTSPTQARPASSAPLPAAQLLVADDNKVNRLLLCRTLELLGHRVVAVENGRLALERLRAERFDLLLLDLEMPELDGFGLLEQRAGDAALRQVPVIVTSSLDGVAPIARCIELGADDYLHKPVDPTLLRARVEASLERKRLRDREQELLERLAPGAAAHRDPSAALPAGTRLVATLLMARLHGVEALATEQPAEDTLELANGWITLMVDALASHGGRIHQMTGDGLAAVFITPLAAAQAALEMAEMSALFAAERAAAGKPPTALALGLATGEIVAGFAGTPRQASYACIGAAVRRAAQLAAQAAAAGHTVLIDEATQAALAGAGMASEPVPHRPAAAASQPPAVHALIVPAA